MSQYLATFSRGSRPVGIIPGGETPCFSIPDSGEIGLRDKGVRWALAGRNKEKLEEVRKGLAHHGAKVEVSSHRACH
jgi:hypothetical protein